MEKRFVYCDGGRLQSGFKEKKKTGDCVARAIAIASQVPYEEVWKFLEEKNATQRKTKCSKGRKSGAEYGIYVQRKWFKDYMCSLGFEWVACMKIGSGCKVHLRKEQLPMGRIICSVSRHYVAVIDGVIHDTYDPSRGGMRCVYGYWKKK